jgi:Xaa-Pro aminopeptidase
MVEGNGEPIEAGNAFSVEPGVYLAGRWGLRLEDIVVATENGPLAMNSAEHSLVRVA